MPVVLNKHETLKMGKIIKKNHYIYDKLKIMVVFEKNFLEVLEDPVHKRHSG